MVEEKSEKYKETQKVIAIILIPDNGTEVECLYFSVLGLILPQRLYRTPFSSNFRAL